MIVLSLAAAVIVIGYLLIMFERTRRRFTDLAFALIVGGFCGALIVIVVRTL